MSWPAVDTKKGHGAGIVLLYNALRDKDGSNKDTPALT